jgi:hypothetical protein
MFESNNIKGYKEDRQYQPWSPMPEGVEPQYYEKNM